MGEMQTQLNRDKLNRSIVTGERIPLPSSYSADQTSRGLDARVAAMKAEEWKVGINPLGGGFYLKSPDENFAFSILGYARSQIIAQDGGNNASFDNVDFRLANARIDLIAEFYKRYSLLVEFDAAAPGGAALVEANLTAKILDEALQFRVGKFTVPFSTENFRSTRSLDTVKRFIALNAMFGLPALDVQQGVMLLGVLPVGSAQPTALAATASGKNIAEVVESKPFIPTLTYYAGVWNGNASATSDGTRSDDNGSKEFQAKLSYQPLKQFSLGVGYDHDNERSQMLTLASLAGTAFIDVPVSGARNGVDADFFWEPGRFSLRGEGLYYRFGRADVDLYGGFLQAGYFVTGDYSGGFQPIVRVESATLNGSVLDGIDGNSIYALTAGFNWFLNGNTRVQLNYVGEYYNGAGNANIGSDTFRNSLLMDFQVKF